MKEVLNMENIKLHLILDSEGRLLGIKAGENIEGYLITVVEDKNIMKPYTCEATPEEDMAKIELAYKSGIAEQKAEEPVEAAE